MYFSHLFVYHTFVSAICKFIICILQPSVLGRVGDKFAHLDLSGEFPNIVIRTVKRKPLIFDKNPQQTTLRATDDIIYRKSIDGKQEWRYDHDEGRYM